MKKTKVLLITVLMIAVLVLATMLTVGAETPISQEDQNAIEAGYVARVDGVYYNTLSEAIYAVSEADTTVYLLTDYTQMSSINAEPKYPNTVGHNFTLEAISDDVVLTVGTNWLFDLGGGCPVVPTIKNINIDVGAYNLGYFNGVTVNIGEGAHIYGEGNANGLIYGLGNTEINVGEGALVESSSTNSAFVLAGNCVLTVNDGVFRNNSSSPFFYVTEAAQVTITDGTFKTTYGAMVQMDKAKDAGPALNVQGGLFIIENTREKDAGGSMNLLKIETGTINISGGVFAALATKNNPFRFAGDTAATITGGTVINKTSQAFIYALGTTEVCIDGVTYDGTNGNFLYAGDGTNDKITTKVYVNNSTITGGFTCKSNAVIYLLGTTSYPNAQGAGVFVTQGIIDAERVATIGQPTSAIIDHPNGGKVQVFNHYYTSVGGAVSAMSGSNNTVILLKDYTVNSTILISQDVTFSSEMKPDGTRYKLIINKAPGFKVTYGTLTLENIDVECNTLLTQMYGTVILGEGANINVNSDDRFAYVYQGGKLCIDGATINVMNTANNVVRCDNGIFEFNAGTMTIHAAGNDIIRIRGDFVMNGGTLVNYVERNTFYLTGENNTASTMVINGGTIISNNYNTVYADGGVLTFNGGTVVQHAAAIAQIVGTAHVDVRGGVFVADRESGAAATTMLSMYLFYKNSATASATVTGGIYLLYERDYIYLSATAGEDQLDVLFLKNENNFVAFGDGEYYFMAFNDQLNAAPVLSGNVSLDEQTYGMTFTSTVSAADRAAIEAWAASVAGEGVAYTLTYGTLIAPVSNALAADDFTKAAFDALGLTYVNAVAANVPAEGAFTYVAEKNGFTEDEYGVLYTAVPYVIVTVDGVETALYGSYQTDVSASISYLATRLLSDVTDIKMGAYQYASIAVEAAYSRFTVEAQRVLKALMAHVHTNDYKGVCSACQNDSAIDLAVDTTTKLYTKYENEYTYRLVLANGVSYSFELTEAVADLALYDATGKTCALVNGQFACTADGVYYLKATAALVGDAVLSVSHVHVRDFMGYCSVCDTSYLVEVETESEKNTMLKKGENYYYAVELVGGIQYQILTVNGQYVVYNEDGVEMPIANSTFSCEEDGVYYVVVEASVSAMGNINVKHIHEYDEYGDCILSSCQHSVNVEFADIYEKKSIAFVSGKYNYFTIELFAGNNYFLMTEGNLGVWTIYAPNGETVILGAKGDFLAEEDGVYRFVLEAQVSVSARIWFEIEHTCDYGYTGICSICSVAAKDRVLTLADGKLQRKNLKKNTPYYYSVSGMVGGATYELTVPASVNVAAYGVNGGEFVELSLVDGKIVWSVEDGSVLYLVISAAEDINSAELKIAHQHEIDFKGVCGVDGCTESKKLYATVDSAVRAQYENGESYYYVVEWPEVGNTYKVVLDKVQGDVVVYKPNGEVVELAADGSFVGEKMCYYIVVTATADAENGATFTFATVK